MIDPPMPHSRFELMVTASGPTWKDALRNFEEAVEEIRTHGAECKMMQGSPSGTATVVIREDPEMTAERHERELADYVAWLRARSEEGRP